jgi:hypothetical protein
LGHRHRNMYYLTGLPGWLRFGYSPGWVGRSPTGLPPTAQWLMQSGLMPQYMEYLNSTAAVPQTPTAPAVPMTPFAPTLTPEQETPMLEQQMKALQAQLDAVRKRLEELRG